MVPFVNSAMWNEVLIRRVFIPCSSPHLDEANGTSELGTIRPPRVIPATTIQAAPVPNGSPPAIAESHYGNLALERLYLLVHLAYAAPVPGADAIGVGVVLRRIPRICAMIVLAALADPNSVVGGAAVPFRVHPRVVVLARCEVFLVRGGVEDWPTIEPIFLRRRIHKLRVPDACVPRRRLEPKRQCVAHICHSACSTHQRAAGSGRVRGRTDNHRTETSHRRGAKKGHAHH
jgi:hypothetical protein